MEDYISTLSLHFPKVLVGIITGYGTPINISLREMVQSDQDYERLKIFLKRIVFSRYVPDIQTYVLIDDTRIYRLITNCVLLKDDLEKKAENDWVYTSCISPSITNMNYTIFNVGTRYIAEDAEDYEVIPIFMIRDIVTIPNEWKYLFKEGYSDLKRYLLHYC